MPDWAIITIIVVCVLVAVAAAAGTAREMRLIAAHRRFGPEFDRLARRVGARRARAELMERKQRVSSLPLHPLPPGRHQHFDASWTAAQEQFVEVPSEAVSTAAELVTQVAQERGYRVDDHARLLADLSVNHARRLEGYRRAEHTAAHVEEASTEDLRQAMLWYRAMFRELAGTGGKGRRPRTPLAMPRIRLPRAGRARQPARAAGLPRQAAHPPQS